MYYNYHAQVKKKLLNGELTGYEFVDIEGFLPQNLKKEEAKGGYITFYPNVDGIDGFFISKIKRCKND